MTNGSKLPVSLSFSAGTFGSVVADVTLPQANVACIALESVFSKLYYTTRAQSWSAIYYFVKS